MSTSQSGSADATSREPTQTPISHNTVFEAVADHYKQDLREFFTRSNFYLAVHVALLSAIGIRDAPQSDFDYAVTIIILAAGVVLACVWGFVSCGSVFWIRRWRKEIQELSRNYSPTKSYDNIEVYASRLWWKSPEEITKFLPWFFGIIWVALAIALWVFKQC